MAIELEDGTVVLSLPEQVEENKAKVEEVDIKVDNLAARVEAALAGVLHYKGSVATYGDLPADAEIGDVYNVIDTGANYAWTGSEWDELGSVVDLSNCVTLDGAQTISGLKTFQTRINVEGSDNTLVSLIAQTNSGLNIGMGGNSLVIRKTGIYQVVSGNFDLGTSSQKFYDLYLSNALNLGTSGILKYDSDISSFTSNSHISPAVNLNYDLGSSGYRWRQVYSNKIYLKGSGAGPRALEIFDDNGYNAKIVHGGVQQFMFLGGEITSNTIKPETTSKTLGTSSNLWKDLYLSGNAYLGDTNHFIRKGTGNIIEIGVNGGTVLTIGSSSIAVSSSSFRAINDNSRDLGQSSTRWRDLYLSGNISDGTNSVNVADLKALIDYAKAQGWIS